MFGYRHTFMLDEMTVQQMDVTCLPSSRSYALKYTLIAHLSNTRSDRNAACILHANVVPSEGKNE